MSATYEALRRIYNADRSKNNGMFGGEAVICPAFAVQALHALTEAGGQQSPSGYFLKLGESFPEGGLDA